MLVRVSTTKTGLVASTIYNFAVVEDVIMKLVGILYGHLFLVNKFGPNKTLKLLMIFNYNKTVLQMEQLKDSIKNSMEFKNLQFKDGSD